MADALVKNTKPRSRTPAYGFRFSLAYLFVIVAFGGMIVFFAFLVSDKSSSQPWSAYRPAGNGIGRAQEIANTISSKYQHEGRPIAAVDAQPPIVSNTFIDAISVSRRQSDGVGGGSEGLQSSEGTILYVFCGIGQRCALPGGPSLESGQLLRRESLELALYTFKYMGDVDAVVTLLPPVGKQTPAVYLRRRFVENELKQPLQTTLPATGPFTIQNLPDAASSERITSSRFFQSDFQRLANDRIILRLSRPDR